MISLIGINGRISSGKDTVARIIQYLTSKEPYTISVEQFLQIGWLQDNNVNNTWEVKKFAGKLKEIVSILTGIPVRDLEKEEVKQSVLPEEWDYWLYDRQIVNKKGFLEEYKREGFEITKEQLESFRKKRTYRQLLQFVATDLLRNQLHPDIWVNSLFSDYKPLFSIKHKLAGEGVDEDYEPQSNDIVEQYPNWLISDLRFPNEHKAIHDKGGICIRVQRNRNGLQKDLHESETALDRYSFDWIIDNTKDISWLVNGVKIMLKYYKIDYHE